MELKEIKTSGQNPYPEPTLTLWIKSATVFISRTADVLDFQWPNGTPRYTGYFVSICRDTVFNCLGPYLPGPHTEFLFGLRWSACKCQFFLDVPARMCLLGMAGLPIIFFFFFRWSIRLFPGNSDGQTCSRQPTSDWNVQFSFSV